MKKSKAPPEGQLGLFPEPKMEEHPSRSVGQCSRIEKVLAERRRNFSSKEEYYQSDEWRYVRHRKFEQAGRKCEDCGSTKRLEVHHKSYDRLYDEDLADLQVLCFACHPVADCRRAGDNAFHTYVSKVYGDDVQDPSIFAEEFDDWLERKEAESW
jgi:hypothetical protein